MAIERFHFDPPTNGGTLPYAKAVRANGFVFVTGQVGLDAAGQLVAGGIEAETHQTIANVRTILDNLGLGLEHVLKAMVWLSDTADFSAFNTVYKQYFGAALPARACVRADLMGPFRVEIEVVAADRV